jgi:threonine dehydratase
MPLSLPTLADIRAAEARIRPTIPPTPFLHSRTLSQMFGCDLWLKFENLNFTASFKERGALNKLLLLTPEEREKGVVAVSAGNHALALTPRSSCRP